jgi:protein-S-isoprenylcysteine O-methyltransferase Ste14
MVFVLIGVAGFVILFFFDLAALRDVRVVKTVIWVAGYGLFAYALNMIIRKGNSFAMPAPIKTIGIVLSIIFTLLLVYSLLIEIPFKRTYLERGAGSRLVTTGTYALVRHPGVLWLILFLIGVFLATGVKTLLIAVPVWGLMDIIYILVQDRYYFPKQFGEAYGRYQNEVPMLIPTKRSIRQCFKTFYKKEES